MALDPIIGGALIAGGASIVAGGASAFANANLNKKNRRWQEKMVKQQREHEQQLYDARYSPSAQAQNLRAAGINPIGNTQTMNVGTSSSTPTPATTPTDFSAIGEAGQAIASGLHAREAMKLQRDQFNQQVTEQNRRFLLDLNTAELNAEEKRAMINAKLEEIEGMKIDNDTKQINKKMLEDFANAGGNTYKDESESTQASTALTQSQADYTQSQKEYQDLMAKIADEQRPYQKHILQQQANALRAQAAQSYANALLSHAQSEVAKSTKLKIDSETQIGKDNALQDAALHKLQLVQQQLINQGLAKDNVRKALENVRMRITNGDIKDFSELDDFIWYNIDQLLTF